MDTNPYDIAVLPGDGIGPEVVDAARTVLDSVSKAFGLTFRYATYPAGAATYLETGSSISTETMTAIGSADAILLGAMGLESVRTPQGVEVAPQIDIREHYHLFASLRPARLFDGVRPTLTTGLVDMLVIRETTEGLFAGRNDPQPNDPDSATDRLVVTRQTSERLFELAFMQAKTRRAAGSAGRVTLFDKANVLPSFSFLRHVFDEVASRHPEIESERIYVDAGVMYMVTDPARFDVIVTENQFGDIASELLAGIGGGLGLAPSADVGTRHAVFQPCHGSAPEIAGRGLANPVATILSGAMLLDWLAEHHDDAVAAGAARAISAAVNDVLARGVHPSDLGGRASTTEVTTAVVEALTSTAAPTV